MVRSDSDGTKGNEKVKGLLGVTYDANDFFDIANNSNDLVSATTYGFTNGADALADMSSGTTQLVAASQDDTASAVTNIGFEYWFDGVRYTQFSVNANGLMRFGATVVDSAATGRTNDFATTTNNPKVAAYWDDLCTGATGKVHFKVIGSPGSRRLIVEWQNMVTFGTSCATGLTIGTYQVWIDESSSATTPGAVHFAYGNLGANSVVNGGYGAGIGSSSTSFGNVTTATDVVSYAVSDNAQVNAVTAPKSYNFTPNVPTAPSGLNFTAVTAVSQTLNWTDNSSNEAGFAVYRSTDGTNYSFVGQTAADATNFPDAGLAPSTNYFYRVYAVSEGALSSVLSGSNMSGAPGNDSCNGAGGNWSSTGTWTDGSVPTVTDNVTIGSGCTVTVDVTTAVALNLTINSGGTLQSPTTGTVTNNNLTVSGNVTNNGTLDFSTNADTSAAILTFGAGAVNVNFSGTGATTDVRAITVAKGAQSTIVELSTTNFTVRGVNTDVAGYLTITSGTFKISGTFAVTNRTFPGPTYTIPLLGGLWLNNPNYTVSATASGTATTNNGLLRVTQGIYNIGIGAADQMRGGAGAFFTFDGGTINVSGAFDPQNAVTYNQSSGTLNVGGVGNTASNFGTFELFSTTSTFIMSGGTINIINPSTGATKVDYRNSAPTANTNITGGTVVIGATGAPASSIYNVAGQMPSTTVNATQTMRVNNATIFMRGSTVNNNGAIDFTGTSARYDFGSLSGAMTYNGSGTIGSAVTPFGGVGISANSIFPVTLNGAIFANRINLFVGGFINSNNITLGNAGASTTVVQIGSTGLTSAGGSFDVSPVHNQGSGGQIVLYAFETTPRTTGVEINPTRILTSINSVDNPSGLTIAGGDITLTSAAAAIVMTSGEIITGSNTLILSSGTATVTRTNGYVRGNFRKTYTTTGSKTFEVGENGFSPVVANVTALGTNPSTLTVKAVDSTLPGLTPATAVSRNWTLTEGGDLTADLTFTYLDPADVNGTEANYKVFKREAGVTTEVTPNSNNPAANTASATGVSSFSDWGIGEAIQVLTPPTISDIVDQTILEDANTGSLAFTVGDAETPVGSLVVTGSSSNLTLVPNGNIVFGGSGASRNVTVTPAANQSGTSTITVTVTDGDTMTAMDTFLLTVTAVNDAPTLDALGTVTIPQDSPLQTVNLSGISAGGGETQTLTVSAGSNNTGLIPNPTVTYTSANPTGSISFTPVPGQSGMATITVTVMDDGGTANGGINTFNRTFTVNVTPAVTANVVVNPGNGQYMTLKEAFDAINAGTHTGAVTVDINANTTETATASINASGTGSTSYTSVVVRPVGGSRIVEGSLSGTTTGAIVKLNGADNVTIDGRQGGTGTARDLTIRNNSNAASAAGIWVSSVAVDAGATNNIIRNLEVSCGPANVNGNTTVAIIMSGTTISTTSNGTDNDNNQFLFNRLTSARYGIVTRGTTTNNNIAPIISNNIIGPNSGFGPDQITKSGILLQSDTDAVISGNTVQFIGATFANSTSAADRIGIAIGADTTGITSTTTTTSGNYTVTGNIIHDVVEERASSAAGIVLGTIRATGATNNLIANNFIYNVRSNGTGGDQTSGITVHGGVNDSIVFNSISLTGDVDPVGVSTPATMYGNGIRITTANGANNANFTVADNSILIDLSSDTATVHNYPITLNNAGYNFGTGFMDYNNLYINPSNPQSFTGGLATGTGAAATTEFATLANWKTALSPPQDAHSIQADPLYISNTANLHISAISPNVNAGILTANITNDIDGQVRVGIPDIGADEPAGTTPIPNDIAALSIVTPVPGSSGATGTSITPQAVFKNVGTATQTSVQVQFTITGPGGFSYTNMQTIASLNPNQSVTVTFAPTGTITAAGTYNTTAALVAPDLNPANDTVTGTFNAISPLTGTINVGTGQTYTSLTNPGGIFQAINIAGATGNIVINITSDLAGETGAVLLNEVAGGFTVTIKPSGAARTISGGSGGAGLIGFSGADGVTIDGSLSGGTDRSLTVSPGNTGNTGGGIYFASGANGAQNNTVKNVNVWGSGSTTGILLGITFAGNTFGTLGIDNDGNRVENCDVRGAFYGIASLGASTANKDTGVVITKNVMPGIGTAGIGRVGIYVIFADGTQITENNIASVSNPGNLDTIGIAAGSQALSTTPLGTGGISNALISRNYIGVINNNATFSSAGIVVASDLTGTNNITNNMVTGVTGNANAGDIVAGIYINPLLGSTQNVYHNSVSMTGDRLPVTANMFPSYALVISNDQATNVVDNALFNSQTRTGSGGGGGESYAIGFDGPAANVNLLSNYNDLFVSGPISVVGITGDLTTAAQTTTAGTGTNRLTLTDWQTATTEDANSISSNPLFTSLTDLHILMGSPLINVGTDVGVTTDFDGQTRDAMRDIGADEIVGGAMPGSLQFSNATYSGGEAGSPFTATVTRTGGSDGTVTVNYATSNGTATGGASCTVGIDYVSTSGTLTFLNGETSKTFNVTICNDATDEPDETINYTLSNVTGGATLGTPSSAVQTIVDDDLPPAAFTFTISDVRLTEGNAGMTNATFNVTLSSTSPPLGGPLASVQYTTANGTATAGSDYATTSGTLNFNSTGTMTVNVPVNGDTLKEANETFYVNLSNSSPNASITDNQGVGIIIDEDRAYTGDFDRDLKTDFSVFRPSEGNWYLLQSTNGTPKIVNLGLAGDIAVPGDYDGDGLADYAVWRPSDGTWYVLRSSDSALQIFQWGLSADKPVQGDYNGDGKTDYAIFRPSDGTWWVTYAGGGSLTVNFGLSTDRPVQGDYDGDAKTDIAVYRDGTWYILRSSNNSVQISNWGVSTDKPVPNDFDGDGKYDLAIYRDGQWWILRSLTGTFSVINLGISTDVPAAGDYDGDGTSDVAVFRPSTGDWYVIRSSNSVLTGVHWGVSGDVPIPKAYLP